MKGLTRFFASMKTAYDHERALRGMFRLGKEVGRKEQPMTIYRQCCERHGTRLQAVGPGIFVCGSCRVEANLSTVIADVERVTGPMRPLREETDPLVRLVQQAQARPGILMQQHYRSRVLPDRPTEHGQAVRWKQGE